MRTDWSKSLARRFRRALLPAAVFALVFAVHFVWLGFFPERDSAQDRWLAVASVDKVPWLTRYVQTQSYWLGLSYGVALAFAVVAFRRYRERRLCAARNLAIGGVTLSGVLAVAGCFLLGCCGSPMLTVYLSFFGAAFLPFAKPLVAALTLGFVALGWCWLRRYEKRLSFRPEMGATTCGSDDDEGK